MTISSDGARRPVQRYRCGVVWKVVRRWGVRPAGVVFVVAAVVLVGPCVAARAASFPATTDFVPVHPYVFMTAADVQALRGNVNVKKLPWAVNLLAQARADADANPPTLQTTDTISATTTYGKHMLATTLVYLATETRSTAIAPSTGS